jgi:hypothetical protein
MSLVSKSLRNSARGQSCTLRIDCCNNNPETTVLAHLNIKGMRGMGQKGDDNMAVFACSDCHDRLDSRTNGGVDLADQLRALSETQRIWRDKGFLMVKGDLNDN